MKNYFLSIVIPCYNEAHRLPNSFPRIADFITKQKYSIEVIFVNDGSHDNTSFLIDTFIKKYDKKRHSLLLIRKDYNMGKGATVREGVLQSRGKFILFSDADLSTPLTEFNKFLPYFRKNKDIVLGSRELDKSEKKGEPVWRTFIGSCYRFLLQVVGLRGNIRDTQCGFKAFKRTVAYELFKRQKLNGGSFDIELLFLARIRHFSYQEVPVRWRHIPGSTISVVHDMLNHPVDLLRIYYYFFRGFYS